MIYSSSITGPRAVSPVHMTPKAMTIYNALEQITNNHEFQRMGLAQGQWLKINMSTINIIIFDTADYHKKRGNQKSTAI